MIPPIREYMRLGNNEAELIPQEHWIQFADWAIDFMDEYAEHSNKNRPCWGYTIDEGDVSWFHESDGYRKMAQWGGLHEEIANRCVARGVRYHENACIRYRIDYDLHPETAPFDWLESMPPVLYDAAMARSGEEDTEWNPKIDSAVLLVERRQRCRLLSERHGPSRGANGVATSLKAQNAVVERMVLRAEGLGIKDISWATKLHRTDRFGAAVPWPNRPELYNRPVGLPRPAGDFDADQRFNARVAGHSGLNVMTQIYDEALFGDSFDNIINGRASVRVPKWRP